jgi:orotidine-5'-phosphate decarboxylase
LNRLGRLVEAETPPFPGLIIVADGPYSVFTFTMACELILVLDEPSPRTVAPLLRSLSGEITWVKIGLQMYTACGPDCVREISELGFKVFLDLKLHDIPNTVAHAVESAARLPIHMLTLHTSGGEEMMRWAVKAQQAAKPDLLLLGVTVLTSMSAAALQQVGVAATPEAQVSHLARLAVTSGLTGLVCSPLELAPLRQQLPVGIQLITPGIRPSGAKADDQTRVLTPAEAVVAGANYLVVGRPILRAPDPVAATRAILAEVRGAEARA